MAGMIGGFLVFAQSENWMECINGYMVKAHARIDGPFRIQSDGQEEYRHNGVLSIIRDDGSVILIRSDWKKNKFYMGNQTAFSSDTPDA